MTYKLYVISNKYNYYIHNQNIVCFFNYFKIIYVNKLNKRQEELAFKQIRMACNVLETM